MNKYLSKIQKIICIFFIAIGCFISNSMLIHGAEPQYTFATTEKVVDATGATVQFSFHFTRKSFDKKTGTAEYNVVSSFCLSKRTEVYTDYLYVNGKYIGGFSANNGWRDGGCYDRTDEGYKITLKEGKNTIETKGSQGSGGNTFKRIEIEKFSEITATFKNWDGTELGTDTVHIGECPTYPSDPTRHGHTFSKWDISCGEEGMKTDTTITAQYDVNKYNVNYYGNGATSGSTANQTADYDQWFHLSNNGFVRQYTVSYNGNGGTPSKSSDLANATFKGWLDDNPFDGYQSHTFNAPYYAHRNPDVLGAFGYNKEALFNHWRDSTLSGTESRTSSPYFNLVEYMKIGGSDLVYSFGNDRGAYANHWNVNGYREGRKGISTIDTTTNKAYPNQAYVKNFSYVNNTNVDLKANWQLASVTLPSGTRSGYKLIYWKNGSGQNVGKPNETYIPQKNETLIAVWDKAPTITVTNKTFYEGEYTPTQWQNTIRWQGVKASDQEDGTYTKNQIKIVSDNVNVNKNGTYKVVYSVTDSVGQTSTATSTVTVKYNNPPVISAKDQTFYEGQYTDTYWKNTLRWKDVSASDIEDGNITSKIQITADNVNVNKPGVYNVTYKVTDKFGKSATKTVKVTVKYNNPPTIKGEDRWFFEDETITNQMLLERVVAKDIEDTPNGQYSKSRISIIANNIKQHTIGDYKVTYKVTDNYGKSAQTTNTIHIVKKIPTGDERYRYLRFISKDYLNTLKSNSVWRNQYSGLLNGSLNKTTESQAIEHWHLSKEDIERIKQFNATHDWSEESNRQFLAEFADLLQ